MSVRPVPTTSFSPVSPAVSGTAVATLETPAAPSSQPRSADRFAAARAPLQEPRSQGEALDELMRTRASRADNLTASEPPLRRGAQGAAVKELQQLLQQAGFDPGPGDGLFGPGVESAVRSFQEARSLDADGIVGPKTWEVLRSSSIPKTGNAFIDSVAAGAVAAAHQWHIPASVSIAQAIIESRSGQSGLSQKANNLFGMRGSGTAGSITLPTKEFLDGKWVTVDAAFRNYNSQAESIEDHAQLLASSPYYAKARAVADDPRAFANALTGVYATAPNYGEALIRVMDQHDLYRFDAV
jgi:flagellum-specific peptidoglycan hydrolase FlgJ